MARAKLALGVELGGLCAVGMLRSHWCVYLLYGKEENEPLDKLEILVRHLLGISQNQNTEAPQARAVGNPRGLAPQGFPSGVSGLRSVSCGHHVQGRGGAPCSVIKQSTCADSPAAGNCCPASSRGNEGGINIFFLGWRFLLSLVLL